MKKEVRNSKGEVIKLNAREQGVADYLQMQASAMKNALGFEIDITTLTSIIKSVTEQKFFEVAPADYMPVKVGEGAWNTQLTKYRSFNIADDFETGVMNTGGSNSRLAMADAGVDSVSIPIMNWAKGIEWSLMDLNFASQSGNWDLVTAKQRSRKKNWDLGIQRIAFVGSKVKSTVLGLFTQGDVTANSTLITEYINGMTAAEFNTFIRGIYEAYRSNCARTAKPTHFIIPEADYNGLVSYPDTTYPLKTKLQLLEEAFKTITMNPNFKILPNAYADAANNSDVTALAGKNRYVLLNYDEDSLRLDIPVDYTATLANTLNGFQFQNVAYGQYTGLKAYRPLEMLYFDWTPST